VSHIQVHHITLQQKELFSKSFL